MLIERFNVGVAEMNQYLVTELRVFERMHHGKDIATHVDASPCCRDLANVGHPSPEKRRVGGV